jgi:translation elongation factor EF-Ts
VIRLAKVAFDLAAKGRVKAVASAALDSIALIELNGEFVARWADLTVGQRRLLQAVAAGKRITATDTVMEYGLRSASTAQSAARRLLDRQILVRFATGMDFDSPFFKRWVAVNSE